MARAIKTLVTPRGRTPCCLLAQPISIYQSKQTVPGGVAFVEYLRVVMGSVEGNDVEEEARGCRYPQPHPERIPKTRPRKTHH